MGNSSSPGAAPLHTLFLPSTFSFGIRSQFSFLKRLRRALSVRLKGAEVAGGRGGGGGGGGGARQGCAGATCVSMAITSTASEAALAWVGCLP